MVLFFGQSPPRGVPASQQPLLTAASLIPWGRQGRGQQATAACAAKDGPALQGTPRKCRNSWILPRSYCRRGSGHTSVLQTELRFLLSPTDLYTNFAGMILFSPKRSIDHPNAKHHTCYCTSSYNSGEGQVSAERTRDGPAGASLSLPVPGQFAGRVRTAQRSPPGAPGQDVEKAVIFDQK